jgi:propionate CoA-transferase
MVSKIVSVEEAISCIKDEDVVATSGFTGQCFPQELTKALAERFLKTGNPHGLTLMFSAGQGGGKSDIGLDTIAYEGLVKELIFTHCGLLPKIGRLVMDNKVLAYNMPQGVISQLYREIAAKRPGLITHVGLHTYIDPRIEGGKVNELTRKSPVNRIELINIDGRELLFYKSVPINIVLLRGTTADEKGNISMEKEGNILEPLSMAQATKNSGGIVIVQVERIAKANTLQARTVEIPHILVDKVVLSKPENHMQTFVEQYDPAVSGEIRIPVNSISGKPLDERKIIGRRALMELKPNQIVNLGIGTPEEVASVAAEEDVFETFTLTVESGIIGGVPLGGMSFGVGVNFDALVDQPYQFDFYDGGGLDIAFLGMAQLDQKGNINVSKFGGRFVGCGGFINITQNTKKVVFVGTFTSKGLRVKVEEGKLRILDDGKITKVVKQVDQITFSGDYARKQDREVLYVTERAVFRLSEDSIILEEIAPGIDLKEDVLGKMEFKPKISEKLKLMDKRIFMEDKMKAKELNSY